MKLPHISKLKMTRFCKTLPFSHVNSRGSQLTLITPNKKLALLFILLKNNSVWQYKTLSNITCVDYPSKRKRFSITYDLLSLRFNSRVRVKLFTSGIYPLESIESIFRSAGWCESEIWDMFGVFFSGHFRLKRLLTDYGFQGYPLRKDFPLSGFEEVVFDYEKKKLEKIGVELSQEEKNFAPMSPWSDIRATS